MKYRARLKYLIPLLAITAWIWWVLSRFDELRAHGLLVPFTLVVLPALAALAISKMFIREHERESEPVAEPEE